MAALNSRNYSRNQQWATLSSWGRATMNDAPRRRRYRPPGPPITLPAWTRGEALPTDRYLYEAVEHHPLLDENGQPVIGRNGVPVTYDGNPVPPFTIGMLADGYQRLHKALIAEAYEKKRIAEGRPPERSRAKRSRRWTTNAHRRQSARRKTRRSS